MADIVAVLLALSLPWSTSLVGIFGVVLLITVAPTLELKGFLALLKRPICRAADRAVRSGAGRHLWSDAAWGARFYAVGPASSSGAPGSVLSFRALDARDVGVRRVPGLLHAVDADVLDRAFSDPELSLQASRTRRARHLRQELHRPEPGIHAVRGRAGLPDHHAAAGKADRAGPAAHRDRFRLRSSTWPS